MLYLAVSQAVTAVAFACVLAQVLRNHASEKRSHARREDALLDRLLHATGKTWTPPPSEASPIIKVADEELPMWSHSPEQLA